MLIFWSKEQCPPWTEDWQLPLLPCSRLRYSDGASIRPARSQSKRLHLGQSRSKHHHLLQNPSNRLHFARSPSKHHHNSVAARPPTPRQRLAPDGTYFFLKRASLKTESSIIGFAPGTKVTMIEQRGSTSIISDGEHQFETASSELTNDLDIATRVAKADFEAQRKIGDFIVKTVQEHDKQQAEEIATFDKQQAELDRKLRSATQHTRAKSRN